MNKQKLVSQLLIDEGLRLKPYVCTAGKTSIGCGRNLDDVGITRAEALHLLNNDIEGVERDLDRALPWWRNLCEARQTALANLAFNIGVPRLLGFKKSLALLQANRFDAAAAEFLDSAWARQVGMRAARVAKIIRTGVLP